MSIEECLVSWCNFLSSPLKLVFHCNSVFSQIFVLIVEFVTFRISIVCFFFAPWSSSPEEAEHLTVFHCFNFEVRKISLTTFIVLLFGILPVSFLYFFVDPWTKSWLLTGFLLLKSSISNWVWVFSFQFVQCLVEEIWFIHLWRCNYCLNKCYFFLLFSFHDF